MQQITYSQLKQWQTDKHPHLLIDVREREEHTAFNIGGTLIPLSEIIQQMDLFRSELPIVVYCKRGIRSQIAIQRLQRKIPSATFYNLQNGIWHLLTT
ncbi:MAG: rhodanese-like domain-containing protein [Saprospiraceae bacterium]